MKILQVIPSFHPSWGGPFSVVKSISKALVDSGHEVDVYTSNLGWNVKGNQIISINGINVYFFKCISKQFGKKTNYIITPSLFRHAKRNITNYDVVHLQDFRTFQNLIIHNIARRNFVPYILQAHGSLPRIVAKQSIKLVFDLAFGKRLLKDASRVIALTNSEALQYESMGVEPKNISIIPNGINLDDYLRLPKEGSFKQMYKIPKNKQIILYLGRIHKIKGLDLLVKSFNYLLKNTQKHNLLLVIAGPDEGYLKEIMHLVNEFKINDFVLVTGPLYHENKLKAFVDADLFVLPSFHEGFPMTILEAYACKTPVVAARVGGIEELVMNNKTGLLFEYGNIGDLTHSMESVLAENESKINDMGQNGWVFVKDNYSMNLVFQSILELYTQVISEMKLTNP